MSSTNPNIDKKASIDQTSRTQLVKNKKTKHSKKIVIHQSGSPLPPDDFVLFPQDIVKEKHSNLRDAKARKASAVKTAQRSSSPMSRQHRMAPTLSRRDARRPSERQVCLAHMSTVNCTVDCITANANANANAKPLAYLKVPPKAPSPPRLPTPDLSELDEDDLWSCCESTLSSLSKESCRSDRKADSMWNEMGASPTSWHQGNRISLMVYRRKADEGQAMAEQKQH